MGARMVVVALGPTDVHVYMDLQGHSVKEVRIYFFRKEY